MPSSALRVGEGKKADGGVEAYQLKSQFVRPRLARQSSGTCVIIRKWLILAFIALMVLASTSLVNAQGLLYIVNTTSDTVVAGACTNGDAGCSLRDAIGTANAHPGADGIFFDLPANSKINLTGAPPVITEGVSISGPGANELTVRRDTGGEYGIFNVTTTGTVTFSGLTISNGLVSSGFGGGIGNISTGTVNVTSCTLDANTANGGGGIFNNSTGTANITNSTLRNNSSLGSVSGGGGILNNSFGTVNVTGGGLFTNSACFGGGIFNASSGTVTVTDCLIDGNQAYTGGAIDNGSTGTVNLSDSTLDGNSATASGVGIATGGGIFNSGTVNVTK